MPTTNEPSDPDLRSTFGPGVAPSGRCGALAPARHAQAGAPCEHGESYEIRDEDKVSLLTDDPTPEPGLSFTFGPGVLVGPEDFRLPASERLTAPPLEAKRIAPVLGLPFDLKKGRCEATAPAPFAQAGAPCERAPHAEGNHRVAPKDGKPGAVWKDVAREARTIGEAITLFASIPRMAP
jgi:hypothetical protein